MLNAVKFNREAGSITFSAHQSEDHQIILTIADSGIGIDEGDLPRIMEPFTQVRKSSLNSAKPGTGLGLAFAKKIMDIHDAKVTITSQISGQNQGTIFTLAFPPERNIQMKNLLNDHGRILEYDL